MKTITLQHHVPLGLPMDATSGSGSGLLFVNSTGSGRSRDPNEEKRMRRNIRKHIMRDIGKARRKRPRNPQFELELRDSPPSSASPGSSQDMTETGPTSIEDTHDRSRPYYETILARALGSQNPLAIVDNAWGMDPFVAYSLAIALGIGERERPFQTGCFWFPLAYEDSDFFREMLTGGHMRAAVVGHPREKSQDLGLARYTSGMSCISRSLASPDVSVATAASVIKAVIGMICYNYATRDFAQAEVHLAGLERMLRWRGGLQSLANDNQLRLMIFWIDVTSALMQDQRPRFVAPLDLIPPLVPFQHSTNPLRPLADISRNWPPPGSRYSDIIEALYDLKTLSNIIEDELQKRGDLLWADEIFIGMRLNPIAHRLLSPATVTDAEEQDTSHGAWEAVRLGFVLFVVWVKKKCHTYPAAFPRHSATILDLLENASTNIPDDTMKLWLLVLCAITAHDAAERTAATIVLVDTMVKADLRSWPTVVDKLRMMPWVGALFEAACWTLGDEVTNLRIAPYGGP